MRWLRTYGVYLALTLLIIGPLLLPGYILTLDLVFTPTMPAPTAGTPDYLWELLLHGWSLILPSPLLEKLILLAIPLTAGIGMHRLACWFAAEVHQASLTWPVAIYAAGIFFAVNPFTYSRLMAGQYAVLLGYALLPWCMLALLRFIAAPGWRTGLRVTAVAVAISIVSVHTLGELAIVAGVIMAYGLGRYPRQRKQQLVWAAASLGVFVMASSYWLAPLAIGQGTTASTIQSFEPSHAAAFATIGDSVLAKTINVLSLQGFWVEGRSLYRLPQEQLPLWGTLRLALWVVIGVGTVALWKVRRSLAISLLALGSAGLLVAIGTGQPVLTMLGYREPHKFVGLIALSFAILLGFGVARIIYRQQQKGSTRQTIAASCCILLVLLLTPPIYGGFGGQLTPRQYPADWHTLDRQLQRDDPDARALFLPWHQYMPLSFAGRIIANPAPNFFGNTIVSSQNPELSTIRSPASQRDLDRVLLPASKHHDALPEVLARQHIKYIIVSRDYKPEDYKQLDNQPLLKKVWQGESLLLYRNTLYKD